MSGKEILVDTNIILYLLSGNSDLEIFLQGKILYVSFITELELIGYKNATEDQDRDIKEFLSDCSIIPLSDKIKSEYVNLKRKYKVKLPDAVVASTAIALNIPLITADSDFKKINELVMISYTHGIDLI